LKLAIELIVSWQQCRKAEAKCSPTWAVGIEVILPGKEVISMPIKWSEVARAALEIPSLPEYVGQRFAGLLSEIERAIGGTTAEPIGRLRARLQSIQDSVPKDALQAEKKASSYGTKVSLV
jgi:hypothetical protein